MTRSGRSGVLALAAALLISGCATAGSRALGGGGSSGVARDVFDGWLARGDVAGAERSFRAAVDADPGDPWAHMGVALLARRSLDTPAEVDQLLGVVRSAPDRAIALVALERLVELSRVGPEVDHAIEKGLEPLASSGRLRGVAALRARVARIGAAEALGDADAVARLRQENGVVTEWTVVGPFASLRALDFDAELPIDRGLFPAEAPVVAGGAPSEARRIPTPDGVLTLAGEASEGAIQLLASDVRVARGGRYLLMLWTTGSARVQLDGAPAAERRAFERYEPTSQLREVELTPGLHRLVVRYAPDDERSPLAVGLARADGEPSDAAWTASGPGPVPTPVAGLLPPRSLWTAPLLAEALEAGGGPVLARLLAARALLRIDREGAKATLLEAVKRAPDAAPVHATLADALDDDPTLDPQVARSRGEEERRRALERDPADAEVRVELADLQRRADRAADAEGLLAGLPTAAAERPAALVARSSVARARGAPERADALAAKAAAQGSCEARELLYESAIGREAIAESDGLARDLDPCRNGRERRIRHLERRGQFAAALEAAAPLARARPSAVEPALGRARLRLAAGDPAAASKELDAVVAFWPRSAQVWKRLAALRELAGDRSGARSARERALQLDGSDLALRRALALEDGHEVLDDLREDGAAAIRAYEASGAERDTSTALVLDAEAVEFHPGGSTTERVHQIVHVLDQRGVDRYGEVQIPPGSEILTLRTRKRDGRSFEPDGGRAKGAISLAGLEPGDYVEMELLHATRGGPDGQATDPFYFQAEGERLVRSTCVITGPAALGLEVDAHGMPAPPVERSGDRVTIRVLRADVPALVGEPGAPPLGEMLPFLQVGWGAGRERLQRRAADATATRSRPSAEVTAFAAEIRDAAGARATPEALARAAWARVATKIQGTSGSLANSAGEVLSSGRGGRTLLLKAVLDALGIDARVALARPFEADPAPYRFPRHGLYGAPLLRIRAGGRELWVDPDARDAPFGSLQASVLDVEALILPAPGEPLEIARTPGKALVPSAHSTIVRIRVDEGGTAVVEGTDRYSGYSAGYIRGALERFDASTRRRIFEQSVSSTFRGGSLEALELQGTDDREKELAVVYRARVPGFARRDGSGLVAEAPILPAHLGESFARVAERTLSLLVSPSDPIEQRIELAAPQGLALHPGPQVSLASRWGRYERAERLEGGTLVREERMELGRARVAPGEYPDLLRFVKAIDDSQATPLAIGGEAHPGGRP